MMNVLWILLAPALAQQPPAEAPASAPAATATSNIHRGIISFDDDLLLERDLNLRGVYATMNIEFSMPRSWDPVGDARLELEVAHSAALMPDRSTLTISLNGTPVSSTRLRGGSGDEPMRLTASLPAEHLEHYNKLTFEVVQHLTDECEDPFDPALWTRVSIDSRIVVPHRALSVPAELKYFPYPFFDTRGYGPLTMTVAGVGAASDGQLDALAELGMSFGRLADYRGIEVLPPASSLSEIREGQALVVGTPGENPLVGQLISQQVFPRAGEGLLAMVPMPQDPSRSVLVVTGGDAAGLRVAAQALAGHDRFPLLSGPTSIIRSVQSDEPPASRQAPQIAPREDDFTLDDIGVEDITAHGYYAAPVRIPLKLLADSKIQLNGARIGLDYAYSALLDTGLSTLEVRIDNTSIRSISLDDAEGEGKQRLWIDVPFELVKPTSELMLVFHLFPANFDRCEFVSDRSIWGTVFSTTELELRRDHYADLPNLELLRHRLWPLNEALLDEGVQLVVDDQPKAGDASAVLQIAAELGRVSAGPADISAMSATSWTEADDAVVVLAGDGPNAALSSLESERRVASTGLLDRLLRRGDQTLMDAQVSSAYPTVEQVVRSGNRHGLILRAPDAGRLLALTAAMGQPEKIYAMEGNVATLSDLGVQTLDVAEKKRVGEVPLGRQAELFIRNSWVLLGASLILGAFLLALIIRQWASRRGGQV
ncbi:MAG: hypothetical protein ACI8S6_003363 [Myxococcota bacterium]|jgi:hypothetical protein